MTKPASVDRQITVGDKSYTLRFSVRAMTALQDHYKLPSLTAVGQKLSDANKLTVDDMVAMVWAGLRTHHRDLTLDDAMDILDELGIEGMQTAMGDAFQSSMPEAAGEAEDAGDPQ